MKHLKGDTVTIVVTMTEAEKELLTKEAKKIGVTRVAFIRSLYRRYFEERGMSI